MPAGLFYLCSGLTSVEFPSNTTKIPGGMFQRCSSLESITIPEGVTSIGDTAFSQCEALTSIDIPNSVTSIEREAFYKCDKLTTINYHGTEEQFKAIVVAEYNNEPFKNATVNYIEWVSSAQCRLFC